MSDIVRRLRGFLNRTDKQNHQDAIAAADEIERLRNALDMQIQADREISHRSLQDRMDGVAAIICAALILTVAFVPIAAHLWRTVATDWVSMLILGVIIPPIGWVHGVCIIFGIV
jgi:VIT1/CCC1 family predicted Fe2+/Mn2+ transporter